MEIIMENDKLARLSHLCIITLGAAVLLYITIKFLLPAVLPILVALVISSLTRPIAKKAAEKSRMPFKLCGIVTASLCIFFAAYAVVILGEKLLHEMMSMVKVLMESLDREDNIIRRVMELAVKVRDKIPFLSDSDNTYSAGIYDMLMEWAKSTVTSASESFARGTASFIAALPDFIFASVVCVIALFYLTADMDGVRSGVAKFVPLSLRKKLRGLTQRLGTAMSGYVKAYFALMLVTFGELFLGFVLLRVRYAFFLALLVAVIDILPVLGVGTVLLPWSLFLFISGSTGRAVGMLILFGIMYAVRQFAEPRLVGRFMGLHPLLTLAGAFAGYSLFGLWGMLLSPVILFAAKLAATGDTENR